MLFLHSCLYICSHVIDYLGYRYLIMGVFVALCLHLRQLQNHTSGIGRHSDFKGLWEIGFDDTVLHAFNILGRK